MQRLAFAIVVLGLSASPVVNADVAAQVQQFGERVAQTAVPRTAEDDNASGGKMREMLRLATEERRAGRSWEASQAYRRAALERRDEPQAAEAHREAILCLVDLMRSSSSQDREALARTYVTLLKEHLEHFAVQSTADEVRLWEGQLLVSRQDYSAAIAALQQVRPETNWYMPSVKLVAQCYGLQLEALAERGEAAKTERAQLLASATQFLQPIIVGKENRWPQSWSKVQREATLDLARLHLRYSRRSSPYAEQLLTAAVRWGTSPADEDVDTWRTSVGALLVAALARRERMDEAQSVANELKSAPPDVLLETLGYLAESGSEPNAVGELSLSVVRLIDVRQQELDIAQLATLDRHRADALAATGNWAEATTQYAALAAASTDDGEIQERYATLLAQSDSPEHMRLALSRWAAVEKRSRRGGERWFRAREARIEILTRLGDQQEAAKLVQLTRLLDPEWDTASNNAK
jgi:hypothetical protein